MSEFIKAQQEVRANLVSQIQDSLDAAEERGGLDAETTEKIDRIEADIRKADEAIAVAQRNEERKHEASLAARGFVVAEEERTDAQALRDLARGGEHVFERRDIVSSANTVPKSFFDQVFDVARLVGPMLDESEVINTTSGEDLTIPTLTAYGTAALTAEGSAIGESDPTYSSITLGAYKYGQLIQVSSELVTDAGFDIEAHLANAAGNALGFAVNAALTTGDGSNKPNGIINAASTGVTGTATDGVFTADELIELQYTLDGMARRLPGVKYMANGSTIGKMRTLKDDNGNYLYQVNVGQPDAFAGYEVVENPHMASTGTAGELAVAFGHIPSYKVRMAGGLDVASSGDYAFNQDLITYRFLMRLDGDLTHTSHIKLFESIS
ncbi:major capsid protein [Pontimonas phage phiPsal1]|nr:major capsid protein [Pontimonas phage phiPsal1]